MSSCKLQETHLLKSPLESYDYPTRVSSKFQNKRDLIVLDQIRTVDKRRLIKCLGNVEKQTIHRIKSVIKEMLVD